MSDVYLSDGRKVPAAAVQALDDLDRLWPGATFKQARPAVVAAVMDALRLTDEGTSSQRAFYNAACPIAPVDEDRID